jgi:hypothetical protein
MYQIWELRLSPENLGCSGTAEIAWKSPAKNVLFYVWFRDWNIPMAQMPMLTLGCGSIMCVNLVLDSTEAERD